MYCGKKIIAIAPCYNEEKKISEVVRRLAKISYLDFILVVDDGSTDNSKQIAEEHGARVISLPKILGVGAALREGFRYGEDKFDITVVLAGNNKDDPEEISRLLDPIIENHADFVQGSRYLPGGSHGGNMPLYRKIATRIHPFLFSFCVGKKLTESTNGFRAFKNSLLKDTRIALNQTWLNEYALEPYLLYKVITLGYRHTEVPVTKIYPPKALGITKMQPVTGWWNILKPPFLLRLGLKS